MKTVAIIAPDFAPSSYPPALRARFFAQHLRDFGWQPIVIATDPAYYETPFDPENEQLISGKYEVIRTPAFRASLTRKFGIGDLGLRSLWHQWCALRSLCRSRHIDLVFISVPPNYSMILGRFANMRLKLPYVVDYIDPYITDYYKTVPKSQRPPKWRLARAVAQIVEPFSVRYAGHIVGVDKSYTAGVIDRYCWFHEVDATGIPYGGEPGDFDYLRSHPRCNDTFNKKDGLIHMSYVGRGGPDMLPSLRALFGAVKTGLTKQAALFGRLRLHFVGTDYAHKEAVRYQVLPLAQSMHMGEIVMEHPLRVDYLSALQILIDSDALVIVGSTEAHYTASKIFPYILAERPLIGIFHEQSSAVSILRETQAGDVVTFSSGEPPEAKTKLVYERLFALLSSLGNRQGTNWQAFEPYTTRAMAASLAAVFDNVIAGLEKKPR
jgi:hypothetical protein